MRYPQCRLVDNARLRGDGVPGSLNTAIGVHMFAKALQMLMFVALTEFHEELVVSVRLAGRHASRSEIDPQRTRLELVVRIEFTCSERRHDRLRRRRRPLRACLAHCHVRRGKRTVYLDG